MPRTLLIHLVLLAACTGKSPTPDSDSSLGDSSPTDTGTPPSSLTLERILDINGVVTTKGMDVSPDGSSVFLWNYNQDQLERWDEGGLTALADGLVTSFGTDLVLDAQGDVYVSKGGSQGGPVLGKWSGETGESRWGPNGLTLQGTLLLGLDTATVDGSEQLWVGDGANGGRVLRLSPSDGELLGEIAIGAVPLDVAVGPEGQLFVLTSTGSNPVGDGESSWLRRFDGSGQELGEALELPGAVYLARGDNGLLYASGTGFDQERRRIYVASPALELLSEVELPESYLGFAGGISTTGSGANLRVFISAQEGVGSEPICDVLVYQPE